MRSGSTGQHNSFSSIISGGSVINIKYSFSVISVSETEDYSSSPMGISSDVIFLIVWLIYEAPLPMTMLICLPISSMLS